MGERLRLMSTLSLNMDYIAHVYVVLRMHLALHMRRTLCVHWLSKGTVGARVVDAKSLVTN